MYWLPVYVFPHMHLALATHPISAACPIFLVGGYSSSSCHSHGCKALAVFIITSSLSPQVILASSPVLWGQTSYDLWGGSRSQSKAKSNHVDAQRLRFPQQLPRRARYHSLDTQGSYMLCHRHWPVSDERQGEDGR